MTGTRWQCPHEPASCIECMEDGPVARQAFNARHPGVCERCDGQIVIGERIVREDFGDERTRYVHVSHSSKAPGA